MGGLFDLAFVINERNPNFFLTPPFLKKYPMFSSPYTSTVCPLKSKYPKYLSFFKLKYLKSSIDNVVTRMLKFSVAFLEFSVSGYFSILIIITSEESKR